MIRARINKFGIIIPHGQEVNKRLRKNRTMGSSSAHNRVQSGLRNGIIWHNLNSFKDYTHLSVEEKKAIEVAMGIIKKRADFD